MAQFGQKRTVPSILAKRTQLLGNFFHAKAIQYLDCISGNCWDGMQDAESSIFTTCIPIPAPNRLFRLDRFNTDAINNNDETWRSAA